MAWNDAFSVADLYTQLLGRSPDAEGLAYWTQQFGNSVDPTEAATFASVAEPEMVAKGGMASTGGPVADPNFIDPGLWRNVDTVSNYGTPTNTSSIASGIPTSVSDFYQKFYGTSDPAGEAYWKSQFGGDKINPQQASIMINEVSKNNPNINTGMTVEDAFKTYLGGNTDQAGINFWKQQFGNGPINVGQLAQLTNTQSGINTDTGGGGILGTGIGPNVSVSDAAKLAALYYGGSALADYLGTGALTSASDAAGTTLLDYAAPTATGGLGLQGSAALDGTLSSGLAATASGSLGGGLGLTAGEAANLAAMGGAQGLLANAAGGGVLSAAGVNSGALTAAGLAAAAGVGTTGLETLVTDPNGVLDKAVVPGGTGTGTGGGTTGGGGGGNTGGTTDWTALLGGLAGLYNSKQIADQQKAQFDKINATLEGMYSPGSAEYQALWNQMSRADAAAGRVSQLGPRSVDLAGKITGIKSNALVNSLGNQNQMLNSSLMNQAGGLNDILKALGTSGASNSINSAINTGLNAGINTLSNLFTS